ncbi:hypothetical protein MKW92_004134 [Papaver armeniacum]|nr:hypothetical protein MKW92_004134 [Papaver armeniacum]
MLTAHSVSSTLYFITTQNPLKTQKFAFQTKNILYNKFHPNFCLSKKSTSSTKSQFVNKLQSISCKSLSTASPINTKNYEFTDGGAEVELRLQLGGKEEIPNSKDIFVDANEDSITIRVKSFGSIITLIETTNLYGKIKPAETIWYIDEDQLVVNLKKYDPDMKWPDFMESWDSLTEGIVPMLKGTSIYLVGESAEINQKVAKELASGIGYTPLSTRDLLESFAKQTIESWVMSEGMDSVVEAESSVLESLSSHVRAVVATLGGQCGAARGTDKWRHLYSGFTIWLSQSEAADEDSAKKEVQRDIKDGSTAYANAEVVVKIAEWEPNHAQAVAQACLSALKKLILSDKKLSGKKSLYIRLGCRGDWPNIKPPGWDPSAKSGEPTIM